MTAPGLKVEVAFGSTWSDDPAGFTWTDITTYVETVDPNRGRSFELDRFSAGTCKLRLINDDRRFDPLDADGPYHGDLLPGVPVRVRADDGSTVHPVFYGYADGWRSRPGTHASRCELRCTDAFRVFANLTLRDVYTATVLADSPAAYWPFGGDSAIEADLSGNRRDATFVGDVDRGVPPGRLFGSAVRFAGGYATLPLSAAFLSPRVECWIRFPEPPTDTQYIYQQWGFVTPPTRLCAISTTGVISSIGLTTVQPSTITDGRWHHLVISSAIWLDGDELPTDTYFYSDSIGPSPRVGDSDATFELSDVAIYESDLADARIAAHYAAGTAPWRNETTGDRVERILDAIGWPSALRDIDSGETPCGNADLAGLTVLEYLQTLAVTEGGRLFIAADGNVTFHGADKLSPFPVTSTYTFSDDGTGAGILESSLSFALDDTFVFDGAEVQKKYGAIQYAGAASPTRVYTATGLAMRDDAAARALAERVVARYSTPQTRAEQWTVYPDRDSTSWPAILALEIGDVTTLDVTPQGEGDPVEVKLFVEQLRWGIDAAGFRWRLDLYGAPIDARDLFRFDGTGVDGDVNGWGAGEWR